jgi:hypothetical protein
VYKTVILSIVFMGVKLVSHINGRAETEGVIEQGPKENIWTSEEWSNSRMEELHSEVAS